MRRFSGESLIGFGMAKKINLVISFLIFYGDWSHSQTHTSLTNSSISES